MTALVDEVLLAFANERDTNGNEYILRYPPSQPITRLLDDTVRGLIAADKRW
jgi:hypothetical protein